MFCRSCGAKLEKTDNRCPYCGAWTVDGAQREYMENLEEIREDTEALAETPKEVMTEQMKSHGQFAVKVASIVAMVCLAAVIGFVGLNWCYDVQDKKEIQKQTEFSKMYFPKLEELYESGDHQAVYEYMSGLYEEDGSGALYYWEHEAFYEYYGYHLDVTNFRKECETWKDNTGKLDKEASEKTYEDLEFDAAWAFYTALDLAHNGIREWSRTKLNKEEETQVHTYIEEAKHLLNDAFGVSESNLAAVYESCCKDEFLEYDLCKNYAKEALR